MQPLPRRTCSGRPVMQHRDPPSRFRHSRGRSPQNRTATGSNSISPAEPAHAIPPVPGLADALGAAPVFTGKNKFDLLVELPTASDVCDCEPDLAVLATLPARGIIVTAPADLPDVDFVSRFFAPSVGIPEDPVTGSAHCCLGPYWGEKLGKATMTGFQCSERGGTVRVTLSGDRVLLAGHAAEVFSGTLRA